MRRVLAVGAHPDDLVILCGGTLARYAAAGDAVTMVDVTRGDRGSFVHTEDEIAAIRAAESRQAAEMIGAEYVSLGLSDGEVLASDGRQREMVIDLIRQVRPDILITHAPNDYMADHNEVSRLVFDTSFLASLPLLRTSLPAHSVVPPLYHMDTLAGVAFDPVEYVDISTTIDLKVRMLEAHQSQLTWLRDHDGVDIVEQIRTTARFRGAQCGVAFAEGFVPARTWLRVRPFRVLP
jgi:LmbE family N-acetylglucosaminyl deacetylase